jgi:hypothetical protein
VVVIELLLIKIQSSDPQPAFIGGATRTRHSIYTGKRKSALTVCNTVVYYVFKKSITGSQVCPDNLLCFMLVWHAASLDSWLVQAKSVELASQLGLSTNVTLDNPRKRVKEKWTTTEAQLSQVWLRTLILKLPIRWFTLVLIWVRRKLSWWLI